MKKKRKWIKSDAGGYCNVDIDYFIWHECKISQDPHEDHLYCQTGREVTCPVYGKVFRVRHAVYLEEKVVENA